MNRDVEILHSITVAQEALLHTFAEYQKESSDTLPDLLKEVLEYLHEAHKKALQLSGVREAREAARRPL